MQDKYQLFFAHCVTPVTEHNIITVHVINMSQKLIRLWSGMACGTVEPCSQSNVTFFTNTRGQPLLHESPLACPEPHVHFCDTTEKTDSTSTNIFSSQELAATAAWIKTSGLDCDLTQFQTSDKRQVLHLLTEFKDVFANTAQTMDYVICLTVSILLILFLAPYLSVCPHIEPRLLRAKLSIGKRSLCYRQESFDLATVNGLHPSC